jgi:hypothetical protein
MLAKIDVARCKDKLLILQNWVALPTSGGHTVIPLEFLSGSRCGSVDCDMAALTAT